MPYNYIPSQAYFVDALREFLGLAPMKEESGINAFKTRGPLSAEELKRRAQKANATKRARGLIR